MRRPIRLISIGHSYTVALNRRLASEMSRVGGDRWEVTAAAPESVRGDFRRIPFEPAGEDACRVEALPTRWTDHIHVMLYGGRLRGLLSQPWDVVHAWEEPYILAGGQVAALAPKRAAYVFFTAQNIAKTYPPPFGWIEQYCVRRCAGWIAAGERVVEAQLPRGYNRRPHRILPHGVDLGVFAPSREIREKTLGMLGWEAAGAPVVGYLGRFVPEKGLALFMNALDGVKLPWRALLVGSGPMESELRRWGARYGDRVRIATRVTHPEVPGYLNAMDMLCAPSQTTPRWREQFGRMLVEAFACGLPVIGSDSGEIPFVLDGIGEVAAEKDTAGWSRVISRLLDNRAERAEMAQRGLDAARTRFAWHVIASGHLKFFEELLEETRGVVAAPAAVSC